MAPRRNQRPLSNREARKDFLFALAVGFAISGLLVGALFFFT